MTARPRITHALLAVAGAATMASCKFFEEPGTQCGGGQSAEAHALLPDTGIHRGAEVVAGLVQHDTQEFTEIGVWQLWAFGTPPTDTLPAARVRVVRSDGLVLIDTSGLVYRPAANANGRHSFFAYEILTVAARREQWYEGFLDDKLWFELWNPGASTPTTRIQLNTTKRELAPISRCL
jgi:hypothetical protein